MQVMFPGLRAITIRNRHDARQRDLTVPVAYAKLSTVSCPLCDRRKARRFCPALGREICPVCCGTKRLVDINCPSDCPYLASARMHPPATVKRRQERDFRFLGSFVSELNQPQIAVLMVLNDAVRRYRPGALPRLTDADVHDAADAMASTYETAQRGIVYEHQPASLQASRLAQELGAALARLKEQSGAVVERAAPAALRAIARAAAAAAKTIDGGDIAYLTLLDRIAPQAGGPEPDTPDDQTPAPSRIILPPA
jgi:hypothetical protein